MFRFTFCRTCQIWQPPRCNHCPICQTCTLELDHHCHWVGTCLGLRNYHSFYWYLVHLVLLSVFQLTFTPVYLWRLHEHRKVDDREEDFLFTWPEWVVFIIVFFYVIGIGSWICQLFVYHQCIVTTEGRTAYERFKDHYENFLDRGHSPHKRGTSCANFCRIACCKRRVLDSRLDYQLQAASENQGNQISADQAK